MDDQQIIKRTATFVKKELANAEGGHDWWHIYRVWQQAKNILAKEKADPLVVELGALLHDIADAKFHNGDENMGPAKAVAFLQTLEVEPLIVMHVENIVRHISFKGGNHKTSFYSVELGIVQDADRLDALGAIGIARAFNYGGFRNRALYDPAILPDLQMTKAAYKNNTAPTINHFYEKLLLLKERMNTVTGKALAAERHAFMEIYLNRFFKEWEGVE